MIQEYLPVAIVMVILICVGCKGKVQKAIKQRPIKKEIKNIRKEIKECIKQARS